MSSIEAANISNIAEEVQWCFYSSLSSGHENHNAERGKHRKSVHIENGYRAGTYAHIGKNFVVTAEVGGAPSSSCPACALSGLVTVEVLAVVRIARHAHTSGVTSKRSAANARARSCARRARAHTQVQNEI